MVADQGFGRSEDSRLADLMKGGPGRHVWNEADLRDVLQHQLGAPVEFDLVGLEQETARKVQTLSAAKGLLVNSFRDLLHHAHPPVELLEMVKRFAKAYYLHPAESLPREIAGVLYFLSIGVARLRCKRRITELSDKDVGRGLRWTAEQRWIDRRTKELAQKCLKSLEPDDRDDP